MRLAAKGAILTGLAFVIFVVPVVNITGSIGSKPFLDKPIRQPRKLKAVADSSDRAAMTYLSFKYEVFGKVLLLMLFDWGHWLERVGACCFSEFCLSSLQVEFDVSAVIEAYFRI